MRGMQINAQTPQAVLLRIYSAVTRRELLQGTPLNVRMFLRYAVLFVLFPGMLGGFWLGLGSTLLFSVLLVVLLALGMPAEAALAVRVWLGAGVLALAWVSWGTTRAALALYHMRHAARQADHACDDASPAEAPAEYELRWQRGQGATWETELMLSAPLPGVYAVLLQVPGVGRCRLLTIGRRGVCRVHSAAAGAGDMQVLLLYKLQAGQHRLRWALAEADKKPPRAQLTLLSCPCD